MSRKMLCLIAVLIVALSAGLGMSWAEPVKAANAMNVAAFFAHSRGTELKAEERGVAQLQPVPKQQPAPIIAPGTGEALAYVFECEPQGFVVTSADTEIRPVIAYSFTGAFPFEEDVNNILLSMLRTDMRLRLDARPLTAAGVKAANEAQWTEYLQGKATTASPSGTQWPDNDTGLLSTTWAQGGIYNDRCPIDPVTGQQSVTGCVATAMAQVVNFFGHPANVTFSSSDDYSYSYDPLDGRGTRTATVRAADATFSNLTYAALSDGDIARLIFACGVSVKMMYTSSASNAYTNNVASALKTMFGYSTADVQQYGTTFLGSLQDNIKAGKPVVLAIRRSGAASGHAIVCDGYRSEGTYHLNFGWGALSPAQIADAWYALPDGMPSNYDVVSLGVVNITPDTDGKPQLANAAVDPPGGPNSETFEFTVHYYDAGGNAPDFTSLNIYRFGDGWQQHLTMTLKSGAPANGIYSRSTSLGAGLYTFSIVFSYNDTHWDYEDGGQFRVVPDSGNDLQIASLSWDDADRDGVVEGGENVWLKVGLRNNSSVTLSGVDATLSCWLSNLRIDPDTRTRQFPQIGPASTALSSGEYKMFLNATSYDNLELTLRVTYQKGSTSCYQDLSFEKDFMDQRDDWVRFRVADWRIDDGPDAPDVLPTNDDDGVFESGEAIRLWPRIENTGEAVATDVQLTLLSDNPDVEVSGGDKNYPDLSPGQTEEPANGRYFVVYAKRSFKGPVCLSARFECDQKSTPLELARALCLSVSQAPWMTFSQHEFSFGVRKPGDDVVHEAQLMSTGSSAVTITGFQTSAPGDTSVDVAGLPWTVAPGEHRSVLIRIHTTAIASGTSVERTVTVISPDGRYEDTEDTRLVIRGFVSSVPPEHQLTYVSGNEMYPDTNGTFIVWADDRNGNYDIYGYDLVTRQEVPICTAPGDQGSPRIDGDWVAWVDERNGNRDIYAYKLSSGVEAAVSINPARESLLGVDAGRVAIRRLEYTVCDEMPPPLCHDIYNVFVCDLTSGACTRVSNYVPSGHATVFSAENGDFGSDYIVWGSTELEWDAEWRYWQTHTGGIWKFCIGRDGSPVHIRDRGADPSTDDGVIVWGSDDDGGSLNEDQVWRWEAPGPARQVTPDNGFEREHPVISGCYVVYEKYPLDGIWYWDLCAGREDRAATSATADDWRMCGNLLVWSDNRSGDWDIYYVFLGQGELAIEPADIVPSKDEPTEGDTIDVTVTVHNQNPWDATGDVTVRLYKGDPDDGGIQLGSDRVITGGIAAYGAEPASFDGIELAVGWEGAKDIIYARIFPSQLDSPLNDTAFRLLDIRDSDTNGPEIGPVTVEEWGGDGDGVVGADEQIRVSWSLSDPSGISGCSLWIDLDRDGLGSPGARDPDDEMLRDGDYYAAFGPVNSGQYDFAIEATDGDVSPAHSEYLGTFAVVPAEEITVLYNGQPVPDGGTIDLGKFHRGERAVRAITVRNDGGQVLALCTATVTPDTQFAVKGPDEHTLQPGHPTAYTVTLDTTTIGSFTANLSIPNSDSSRSPDGLDENPFDLTITASTGTVPGDVNGDCRVNILDLLFIRDRINKDVRSGDNWNADANGDGKINLLDLLFVRDRLNATCQ